MRTLLDAIFEVISVSLYFVILIFKSHGPKVRGSANSQNPLSESLTFVHFDVFFINV